jgi:acetyl esterase/lipase
MQTLPLVDTELRPMVAGAPRFVLNDAELARARSDTVTFFDTLGEPNTAPRVLRVPGRRGDPEVELRVHGVREGETKPALFMIHGGGFVMGAAGMRDGLDGDLANETGAIVVAVDYRLAPETAFPGALHDCYAALEWLFAHAAELGADPDRIFILGESGGGGLGAALALLARDRSEITPAGQMLIYPMLDHRTGTAEEPRPNPSTGEFAWTRDNNRFGWESMLGGQALFGDALGYFSPSTALRLDGLPPAFIAVGALDLFMEEDVDYAARLSRAGVGVELHVYPGAIHGFDIIGDTGLARQFRADRLAALHRWFAKPPVA